MDTDATSVDSSAQHTGALPLVVFRIDRQRYALPLAAATRALPMVAVAPLPHAPAIVVGVINYHGAVLPVLDVRQRFGLPPRTYGVAAHILAAQATRRAVALPVDEVLGVSTVGAAAVIPPRAVLPQIEHVAGIVALADGLLFIQDLDAFLFPDEEQRLSQALAEHAAA